MVSTLTFNHIFRSPLFQEALRFVFFTNRAIALIPVFFIKGMTKFTVGLTGVYCPNATRIKRVFSNSQQSKMVRANTVSDTTDVVDDHSVRNITDEHVVSNSMCSASQLPKEKSSVSIFIQRTLPQFTSFPFLPLGIKTRQLTSSISFHKPTLPFIPFSIRLCLN